MSAVNMDVDQSSSVVPQEAPSVVEGGEAPTAMETENTPTADATTDSTAEPSTIPVSEEEEIRNMESLTYTHVPKMVKKFKVEVLCSQHSPVCCPIALCSFRDSDCSDFVDYCCSKTR